jgi:hypothetical protein
MPTDFMPRRALLHPLWLGALAVLVLNDHVLKGSGLLPGVVTGKLSDFAGMLVAPLLFATLLCVRGRIAWLLAHVAVGVVFAAIQLSIAFADLWSSAMGLLGFPWVITSDPTDLIALPVLAASFYVFPLAMSVRANVRCTAECGAALGGLFACVATSAPPSDAPWTIEADVYFHNDNDFDAVLRIRHLSPAAAIDCDVVEEDPGRLLTEPMFGPIESWTVWPDANLPLAPELRVEAECHAVWLEADSVAPVIVFWRPDQVAWTMLDGEGIDPEAPGFVSLAYDDEGRGTYETELDILFTAVPPSGRVAGVCAPQSEAERVVWSDEIPSGIWTLGAVNEGVDGCVAMDLHAGFEPESGPARSWTLCLPAGAFPFEPGQRIDIFPEYSAAAMPGTVDGLSISELLIDSNATTGTDLVVSRGTGVAPLFGMSATFAPMFECDAQVEVECGTVTRPGTLTLAGGGFNTVSVGLGHASTTDAQGGRLDVYVGHAEQRYALASECAEGPDELGTDIELVAVHRGITE